MEKEKININMNIDIKKLEQYLKEEGIGPEELLELTELWNSITGIGE